MNFSILIPCFNEKDNIPNLLSEIKDSLINFNYEILIIDDFSTDNSVEIINNFKSIKNLHIIENKKNRGQSFCIYEGVKAAKYKTMVTIDCDGQNNPKDIPKLLKIYFENINVDLVAGIRKNRKDSFIKVISSKFANYLRNLIFKDQCSDTGCSLKVFNKEVFLKFPFFDGIHRFIPALFRGIDKKAIYIDVDHRKRKYGHSKYGTINRALKGINDIFKVIKIIKKIRND